MYTHGKNVLYMTCFLFSPMSFVFKSYKVTSITSAPVCTISNAHGYVQCKKEQGKIMHKNT